MGVVMQIEADKAPAEMTRIASMAGLRATGLEGDLLWGSGLFCELLVFDQRKAMIRQTEANVGLHAELACGAFEYRFSGRIPLSGAHKRVRYDLGSLNAKLKATPSRFPWIAGYLEGFFSVPASQNLTSYSRSLTLGAECRPCSAVTLFVEGVSPLSSGPLSPATSAAKAAKITAGIKARLCADVSWKALWRENGAQIRASRKRAFWSRPAEIRSAGQLYCRTAQRSAEKGFVLAPQPEIDALNKIESLVSQARSATLLPDRRAELLQKLRSALPSARRSCQEALASWSLETSSPTAVRDTAPLFSSNLRLSSVCARLASCLRQGGISTYWPTRAATLSNCPEIWKTVLVTLWQQNRWYRAFNEHHADCSPFAALAVTSATHSSADIALVNLAVARVNRQFAAVERELISHWASSLAETQTMPDAQGCLTYASQKSQEARLKCQGFALPSGVDRQLLWPYLDESSLRDWAAKLSEIALATYLFQQQEERGAQRGYASLAEFAQERFDEMISPFHAHELAP